MVIRVGMLGFSEGNGHPFSFSSIINGYDDAAFADAGWPVIHDYLKLRSPADFGFGDVKVTHAWGPDAAQVAKLCAAAKIPNAVTNIRDMLGQVDAVIVARDDWKSHRELASLFLDAGACVFIDKPLALDEGDLDYFGMFLDAGKLMSCSGLRYARELDSVPDLGQIKTINGVVLIDWERYGVHLLDAAFTKTTARPVSIARNPAAHPSFSIAMNDGSTFTIDTIGMGPKTFRLSFFGDKGRVDVDMNDNFSAFRGTLGAFFDMVRTGRPQIDPADTLCIMKTLMAGHKAKPGEGHVDIG